MSQVISNFVTGAGGVVQQAFGIDVALVNSGQEDTFSSENIILLDHSGEGVISGKFTDGPYVGETGFLTTRSIIKTFDLISEGEIEGISSGDFKYSGHTEEGQIGYEKAEIKPYGKNPEAFLRSVYLNDTPVVNANNQYNFQSTQISICNGTPSGIVTGDSFLNVTDSNPIEKSRVINERLRGPDRNEEDDNPFYYHSKKYRFVNKALDKLRVHIKVPALSYTKVSNAMTPIFGEAAGEAEEDWPLEELGEVRGSEIKFNFRYRPIERDAAGNIDFDNARTWYGKHGTGGADDEPFSTVVAGLIRSPYMHPYTVNFDSDLKTDNLVGWEIEVTRVTLDSIESHIANQSYVDSITEIYESTLSYPNSAIASMSFNAEYFSQVPTRAYDVRLLKVKVPDTYSTLTRTYENEPWGGDFKPEKEWTDNPAWIFYDLITNKRYGLGKFLGDVTVDRWTLYEISKFCDTLVSDGEGGYEPRFTCNVLINTREDAIKVLKDFASVFRSVVYYGYGNIYPAIDKPRDIITQFNCANVEGGNFTYSSSSKKTLPTVCLVRYNDKQNFYKPAIEYVENVESIRKFGLVEKEITAFACSSRSQAIRLGRWILSTESEQTESVTFTAGPEGMLLRPGDIVKVTDTNRSETIYGGRAIRADAKNVVLDREVDLQHNTDYSLTLTTPTYFYDPSIVADDKLDQADYQDFRRSHVQSFDFNSTSTAGLTIATGALSSEDSSASGLTISSTENMFSTVNTEIVDQSAWSLTDISQKNTNLYTVLSTKENDNLSYGVEALLHSTGKYSYIESGVYYSYVPSATGIAVAPPSPYSVELSHSVHPDSASQSTRRIKIKVKACSSSPPTSACLGSAIGYRVYFKTGSRSWITTDLKDNSSVPKDEYILKTTFFSDFTENGDPVIYIIPPSNGNYAVRVFALNSVSIRSSSYTDGKSTTDSANGIEVTNHYPVKDVKIHSLRLASNYAYNEVPEDTPTKESYPTANSKDILVQWDSSFIGPLSSLPIFYKVSIHTPNAGESIPLTELKEYTGVNTQLFNFTFDRNAAVTTGPLRHFDLVVQAEDLEGVSSSGIINGQEFGWDIMEIINPKPTGYYLTPRRNAGKNTAYQIACDPMWTNQYIDGDGFVQVDLLANSYPDLAGGYAYVSKHPFSGADFHQDGTPKLPTIDDDGKGILRPNLVFGSGERFKTGEYVIDETHFTAPANATFSSQDHKVTFKPDLTGAFAPPYYIAVKFYDDFDREVYNRGLNANWNHGLLNDTNDSSSETGLWLSFGRDTVLNGAVQSEKYCLTSGACGNYVGSPDVGTNSCNSSTFSIPIHPTKYYSANQGGFKYWIRMNVNGQWEGQGISHVKVLTQKDVKTLYNYKGFYEYACHMKEYWEDSDWGRYWYPNKSQSTSVCRFRQAQVSENWQIYNVDAGGVRFWGGYTTAFGYPYYLTTGATRNFMGHNVLSGELSRAGISPAYDLALKSPDKEHRSADGGHVEGFKLDKLTSYNERGELIENKSRPLRGFRRFRVYFDEKNLPSPATPSGLASYAVVGLNAWNGEYESWPANSIGNVPPPTDHLEDSILFAKDGYNIFPSSVQSWLKKGDVFENIPGVWNHHPAGFGQGFGGLAKTQKYFDVHLGRMIDDSYLNEGFFGVVTTNDYSIGDQLVRLPLGYDQQTGLHEAVYDITPLVTKSIADGGDGSGKWNTFL